jgi:hypothetical protein
MDLSKVTYEDFCKALYTCKTAAEVRTLVETDYGIKLAPKGSREDALREAYEAVCKSKAPAAAVGAPAESKAPGPVADGWYKVRVKASLACDTRRRAGLVIGRRYVPVKLTAAQVKLIREDACLQMLACEAPAAE